MRARSALGTRDVLFSFADRTLDVERRELRHGSEPVAVEPLIGVKKITPTDSQDKREPSHTSQTVIAARGQQAALAVHKGKRLRHGGGN
jgi:hypothetical protein